MSGFRKGTRVWLYHPKTKERQLMPQVTILDRVQIQLALVTGWSLGMGAKGKIKRAPQVSVLNTVTNEQKWIPKEGSREYLLDNKDFVFGFGNSYNNGRKNPNYGSTRGTKGWKAPRDWARGSTRMYNPQDETELGKYIIESEINHYLSLGWVTGIRYKTKVTCELCLSEITPQMLTHHPNNLCRNKERKRLLQGLFVEQDLYTSKMGFSKSFMMKENQSKEALRYKELVNELRELKD